MDVLYHSSLGFTRCSSI